MVGGEVRSLGADVRLRGRRAKGEQTRAITKVRGWHQPREPTAQPPASAVADTLWDSEKNEISPSCGDAEGVRRGIVAATLDGKRGVQTVPPKFDWDMTGMN